MQPSQNEDGFTLIELLVVIIIIGILAAVAIPVFLSQRSKAVDAGIKSDVRTVATQFESYESDYNSYPLSLQGSGLTGSAIIGTEVARITGTDVVTVDFNAAGNAYCLVGTNTRTAKSWYWISTKGGLQLAGTAACGAY